MYSIEAVVYPSFGIGGLVYGRPETKHGGLIYGVLWLNGYQLMVYIHLLKMKPCNYQY